MSTLRTHVGPDDHVAGPRDAEIALVEYGDFECPYCGMAYWAVEQLRRALGDRLCFVFRHFPLSRIHPRARKAAEAAEAAGAQGRFWEMHGMLFTNQQTLGLPDLTAFAHELDLDLAQFSSDLTSGRFASRVRRDLLDGARSGVNGTPTFFVNGERHDGVLNYEGLVRAVEGRAPRQFDAESPYWSR